MDSTDPSHLQYCSHCGNVIDSGSGKSIHEDCETNRKLALTDGNQLQERVCEDSEKEFQIRTKNFDIARTMQIEDSIASVKTMYTTEGVVRFAPENIPPHLVELKELEEDLEQRLVDRKSILCGNNNILYERVDNIDNQKNAPQEGFVFLSQNMPVLLNLRPIVAPESHIGDIFLSLSHQPSIVLTVVKQQQQTEATEAIEARKAKIYNVSVAKGLSKSLNSFLFDNYAVVFGVLMPSDFKQTDVFDKKIRHFAKSSSLFVPQDSLMMTKVKHYAVLNAFWTSVAEAKSLSERKDDVNIMHFLTAEQCKILVENMNQKRVLVRCAPHSGATVLMMEVATRLQKIGPTLLAFQRDNDVESFKQSNSKVSVCTAGSKSLPHGTQHVVANENVLPSSYLDAIPGHIWIFSDFLRPTILDCLIDCLKIYQFMMVLGSAGDGKTVVGNMLLDHYRSMGISVKIVNTAQDIISLLECTDETVVLVDDVFGIYTCDFQLTMEIENCLDALRRKNYIKFVFTSRTDVYNVAKDHLGKFKARFDGKNKLVLKLNQVEKSQMLRQYLERSDITLSEALQIKIVSMKLKHGFPHSCQIFTTLKRRMADLDAIDFFTQPHVTLIEVFHKMLTEKQNKFLLYILLACEGLVLLEEIQNQEGKCSQMFTKVSGYVGECTVDELSMATRNIPHCILKVSDDTVQFQHPSLYETAFKAVANFDVSFVLEYGPLSFIQEDTGSDKETSMSLNTLEIQEDTEWFEHLAKRFADELTIDTVSSLCRHQLLTRDLFVDHVLKNTNYHSMQKLIQEGDFLYWMSSSKDVTLSKHVLEQYDKLCTQDFRHRAVLGCCRWGNVDALGLMLQKWSLDSNFINEVNEDGLPCLIVASNQGHADVVKQLIEKGANSNACDGHTGSNALHWAAAAGHASVINILSRSISLIDSQNHGGATPLFLAAANGHLNGVKILCSKQANPNMQIQSRLTSLDSRFVPGRATIQRLHGSDRGFTPLHVACYEGHPEIVKVLLHQGADLHKKSNQGPPAVLAAKGNHFETFRLLLTKTEKDLKVAISGAFEFGRIHMIELVLNQEHLKENVFIKRTFQGNLASMTQALSQDQSLLKSSVLGFEPLHFASVMGHEHVVDFLLGNGADVDTASADSKFTALHCASITGQTTIVKKLMMMVQDVNFSSYDDNNALHFAAMYGKNDTVECLLQNSKIDINFKGHRERTALHFASIENHLDVVKTLLGHGANIEALTDDRGSPLMFAVFEGNLRIVEHLISCGASLNPSHLAFSPLAAASVTGNTAILKFLIEKGADINHTGRSGFSILHLLAWLGSTDVLRFLMNNYKERIHLDTQAFKERTDDEKIQSFYFISSWCKTTAGRDINLECYDSGTALHVAADTGHSEVVKLLIDNGASLKIQNKDGQLAKDIALKKGDEKVLSLFHVTS